MKALFAVFLSLAAGIALAQQEPAAAPARGHFGCEPLDLSRNVDGYTFERSTHFAVLQRAAVQVNNELCQALNDPLGGELPMRELAAFGLLAEAEANARFGGSDIEADVAGVMRAFANALNGGEAFPTVMPDFETLLPDDDDVPFAYSVTVANTETRLVSEAQDDSCVATAGAACSVLALDLDQAIRPYKRSFQVFVTARNATLLGALQSDWDAFFEEARSMTMLDLALTSIIERDHMRQGFLVGPVPRQWFALHPNLVMQYTEDAAKGERFQLGLAIDWLGVNYWKDSFIGIPFGASITSSYADRPGISSVGHGVTLYFNNDLAIGWTRHDDDDAFHVSVDLLKLWTDKEQEFEAYKQKVLSMW